MAVHTEDLPRIYHPFQTGEHARLHEHALISLLIRAEVLDALGKRPNGVQGSPGKFLDFGHSNRLEMAFQATKYDTHRPGKGNC